MGRLDRDETRPSKFVADLIRFVLRKSLWLQCEEWMSGTRNIGERGEKL